MDRATLIARIAQTLHLLSWASYTDEYYEDQGEAHPDAPGPGGSYDDAAPDFDTEPESWRAECLEVATGIYDAIAARTVGGDPAARLLEDGADGDEWASDMAMEAVGSGVAWSDDHDPVPGLPLEHVCRFRYVETPIYWRDPSVPVGDDE